MRVIVCGHAWGMSIELWESAYWAAGWAGQHLGNREEEER